MVMAVVNSNLQEWRLVVPLGVDNSRIRQRIQGKLVVF